MHNYPIAGRAVSSKIVLNAKYQLEVKKVDKHLWWDGCMGPFVA